VKRSSAILLWISLVCSATGSALAIDAVIMLHRLLHPQLDGGASLIEPRRASDFASGTVVHVSPTSVILFLPIVAWVIVRITDRGALNRLLGRVATWSALIYVLLMIGTILWIEDTISR
jgi:hypothetical protein